MGATFSEGTDRSWHPGEELAWRIIKYCVQWAEALIAAQPCCKHTSFLLAMLHTCDVLV